MSQTALVCCAARRRPCSTISLGAVLGALLAVAFATPALAQNLPLYTYRDLALIKPLLDAFTEETGIQVSTVVDTGDLGKRMQAEGQNSPADVLLTVDVGRFSQAKAYGVTQPVSHEALEQAVPAAYRDPEGHWFGISLRGRVVYASKDRVAQVAISYEDLADPQWQGKVCTRSGQHLYNVSLFAAVIAHMGETGAEQWLRGLKANLARTPLGGDRDVAKDIQAGVCDIGFGNTYYVALMRNREPEGRAWGEAVKVILPTFQDGSGTHVNISGVAMAKNAPNRASALRFMTFLVSDRAQKLYAELVYEYPVKAGIALDPTVASFGTLKPDTIALADVAQYRKAASELVGKIGFDR